MVHGYTHPHITAFASLNVRALLDSAPIVPGWLAVDLQAQPDVLPSAAIGVRMWCAAGPAGSG